MKYFRLEQDKRIPYGVLLTDLNSIGGYYESKKGDLSALDDIIVSFVNSSQINFYPDILDRQIFMIRGAVKEIFDIFLPELEYNRCFMIDPPYGKCERYYIPVIDLIPCFSDKSVKEKHGTKLEKIVLQEKLIKDKHVFRVADINETTVIVSLEVVEAVLRRKPAGIALKPVILE